VTRLPDPETFLSGEHGTVAGRRRALRRAADRLLDVLLTASGMPRRLDALAARAPARDVLVLGIVRPELDPLDLAPLRSEHHRVRHAVGSAAELGGGKFENLNALLEREQPGDWTLAVDDDVALPDRFLDRFVALCEHFDLALAQPAQSLASHAAWPVVRRRPFSLVRETRFVEIGPVTAFRRDAAAALLPFPPLRYGWGIDLAWGAVARERGWRCGIADALVVRHEAAPVASSYPAAAAIAEAQEFLAGRRYVSSAEARTTLATHRSLS